MVQKIHVKGTFSILHSLCHGLVESTEMFTKMYEQYISVGNRPILDKKSCLLILFTFKFLVNESNFGMHNPAFQNGRSSQLQFKI